MEGSHGFAGSIGCARRPGIFGTHPKGAEEAMKKLRREYVKRIEEITEALRAAADVVNEKCGEVNDAVGDYNTAIDSYNAVLEDARDLQGEITASMDEYDSDRSDKWQDSKAGHLFKAWQADWADLDFEDLPNADEVEEPDLKHADALDSAEREIESE
jgi:hypothetical protein